jgi:hypothetical protein
VATVRAVVAAFVGMLVIAACHPSKVDPNADIDLSGRVVRQGDRPTASGSTVFLTRDLGPSDLLPGVLTAGLACLSQDRPEICRSGVRRVATDDKGSFAFHLKGRDTQTAFGNTRRFNLATETAATAGHVDGAGVTAGFVIQTETLHVPDLGLWEGELQLGSNAATATATWDALPVIPTFGKLRQYDLVFTDAAGDPVWSFPTLTRSLSFDLRLLEDSRGVAALHALASEAAPATPLDLDYRAPTKAFASAAGAPVSRGAACTLGQPGGPTVSPCPLTDADFSTSLDDAINRPRRPTTPTTLAATPSPATTRVPPSAVVDTGSVRALSLVVVRGCSQPCSVEVSANGTGWAQIGSVQGEGSVSPPGGTAVARYVRVSVATGVLRALREVSAWDDTPAPAAGAGLAQPGVRLAGPRSAPKSTQRVSWWLMALALLLLLVLVALIVRRLTFRPLWKAPSGD